MASAAEWVAARSSILLPSREFKLSWEGVMADEDDNSNRISLSPSTDPNPCNIFF